MITKLLAYFGYFPSSELQEAHREGYCRGFEDMHKNHKSILENTQLKYAGMERERNHLMNLIANNRALQVTPMIVVEGNPEKPSRFKDIFLENDHD